MKILHIGKFYPPYRGGMENYLCDLAEAQAKQGHDVTVLVHNHNWSWLKSKSEEVIQNGVCVIRKASLRPIFFTPIMLGLGKQLKRLIDSKRPDVIHLHMPNPSLFFLLGLKQAKQIPWLLSWHSDMVTENSGLLIRLIYSVIKPLETKLINQSSLLLVSSEAYATHSAQLQIHKNKTKILPLGINTHEIQQLSIKPAIDRWPIDQCRLLHVGRLTFYKNQAMLIAAMNDLETGHLLIAGAGQLAAKLNALVNNNPHENIQLLGAQSWQQIHELYAACDIFCMASHDRAESFGVVLLEAMYHDKIILVPDTRGSGMQGLAENYNKGFVYQVGNQQDFVAKIKYIQANLKEIMSRPRDFKYSIDDTEKHISKYYQSITSGV